MASNNNPERVYDSGFVVDGDNPNGHKSITGAVEAMVKNLRKIKVWAWLVENNEDASQILSDQDALDKALNEMTDDEMSESSVRGRVLKAIGLKDKAEVEVENKSLRNIVGADDKDEMFSIDHDFKTKDIDEWLKELAKEDTPDKELIDKLDKRMKLVFEKYGPKNLEGVTDGRALAELDDRLEYLRTLKNIRLAGSQSKLTGGKTSVGNIYEKDIKDVSRNSMWRIRTSTSKSTKLEALVAKTREESLEILTRDGLKKLSGEDLIKRLSHVNELRDNIVHMLGSNTSIESADRLRSMLRTIQTQYEMTLADKLYDTWKLGNRSGEWSNDVARIGVKNYLENTRKTWSVRVEVDDKDSRAGFQRLINGAEIESAKYVEKMRARGPKVNEKVADHNIAGPSSEQFLEMKKFKESELELNRILGANGYAEMNYNLFEDNKFWEDLASGDEGMKRIVDRAKPKDEKAFKAILEKMRTGKEVGKFEGLFGRSRYGVDANESVDGEPDFQTELKELMNNGRYGAAANLMLEYTTRVGIRETGQDLEFMMLRRNFLNKISKISPDFAAQFEMNQMLGYMPNLSSQKIEDFLGSYQRLHSKGNLDIIEGDNALMGGNQVEYDGKKITFSVKTFAAILRNPRHMIRVLRAGPNTMDSTLQGIMLEEMYGRGARLEPVTVGRKRELFLALPGQEQSEWRSLKDIKVKMRFAELDTLGFNGWSKTDVEKGKDGKGITLEEALNRNQWMLRDGMAMMWYSEEWKHVVAAKSYNVAVLGAAAKALLTSDIAKAAYQMHFANVAAPMAEVAEITSGSILSGMSVYKAKDMVGKNIERNLLKDLGQKITDPLEAKIMRERYESIGKIFVNMHVRSRDVRIAGETKQFMSRIRMNDMARLAFNDLSEESDEVLQLLTNRFEDMGIKGMPTKNELLEYYRRWKSGGGKGNLPKAILKSDGKTESRSELMTVAYFGQEYDALWREVNELKMSGDMRKTWDGLSMEELNVLWKMNDKVTGKPSEHHLIVLDGETQNQALKRSKEQFLGELYIGAFVDRTSTNNGDDHDQYALKYAPAKYEALKPLYQLVAARGTVADFEAFIDQIQLFMEPEERLNTIALLGNRLNAATSGQRLSPLRIPLTTSRRHQKEHPSWKFWEKKDHKMRGAGEIEWIKHTDLNGNTFIATTVNGDRAYEEEYYGGKGLIGGVVDSGNWSKNELDIDLWKPVDFEMISANLGVRMQLDRHSVHIMAEKMLGTAKDVEHVFGKFLDKTNMSSESKHNLIHTITGLTSKGKLLALKLFLFNDPKYAMWTLMHEFTGFTGKAFEQVFGFSVGGGGGSHGH